MKLKTILQYELFFWMVLMIVVSGFTIYYGFKEKAGIEKLIIYGCPYELLDCPEEDEVIIGIQVDNEYNFRKDVDGNVIDPYGHYAKKKRMMYYLGSAILFLLIICGIKIYLFVKRRPKIIEYIKRRREDGQE